MSTIPKRRKRKPMGLRVSSVIRCPGHLQFIRGCECSVRGKIGHMCGWSIEAAHVRKGTDGGVGTKPGDNWTIPLCAAAHARQHNIGEPAFERLYGIDMKEIAAKLWLISPAGKRHRAKAMEGR